MRIAAAKAAPRFGWSRCAGVLAALAGLSAWQTPAQAGPQNLVTDGTFTATSLSSGGFICQNGSGVGSTCTSNLTYWTATCSTYGCTGTNTPGSILFPGATNVVVTAFNGGNGLYPTIVNPPLGGNILAVDGDPNYAQTLSQTINGLVAGNEYVLTFYQGAAQQNGLTGATTEQWKVTFGSSSQTSNTMNNASKGVVGWNLVTMNFIATSSSEVLSFLSMGTPTGEPPVVLLADVDLFLPEPGSLAILGAGMLGLLIARRRARA